MSQLLSFDGRVMTTLTFAKTLKIGLHQQDRFRTISLYHDVVIYNMKVIHKMRSLLQSRY